MRHRKETLISVFSKATPFSPFLSRYNPFFRAIQVPTLFNFLLLAKGLWWEMFESMCPDIGLYKKQKKKIIQSWGKDSVVTPLWTPENIFLGINTILVTDYRTFSWCSLPANCLLANLFTELLKTYCFHSKTTF